MAWNSADLAVRIFGARRDRDIDTLGIKPSNVRTGAGCLGHGDPRISKPVIFSTSRNLK